MVHHRAIGWAYLAGDHPLVFQVRHLAQDLEVRYFTLGWDLKFPGQRDHRVGGESFGMQPALVPMGLRRQVAIVAFGSAGVDPGYQRIDVLLAEPGVVAELHAVLWIR